MPDGRVQEHDGKTGREVLLERPRVELGRKRDQAVHAPADRAQQLLGFDPVLVRSGDEEVVPAPPRRDVDAADELGKELAEEVRQENAEGMGLAGDETARGAVGSVAELLDGAPDAQARLFADGSLFIHDAGDGGDRHARFPRDLPDRDGRSRPRRPGPPGCRIG